MYLFQLSISVYFTFLIIVMVVVGPVSHPKGTLCNGHQSHSMSLYFRIHEFICNQGYVWCWSLSQILIGHQAQVETPALTPPVSNLTYLTA